MELPSLVSCQLIVNIPVQSYTVSAGIFWAVHECLKRGLRSNMTLGAVCRYSTELPPSSSPTVSDPPAHIHAAQLNPRAAGGDQGDLSLQMVEVMI